MRLPNLPHLPAVGSTLHVTGVTHAALPLLLSKATLHPRGPVLWLVPTQKQAAQLVHQFDFWRRALKRLGGTLPPVYRYQYVAPELADQPSFRAQHLRNVALLARLVSHAPGIYVFDAALLDRRLPARDSVAEALRTVSVGETLGLTELAEHLVKHGYQAESRALLEGSFARRGGTLEVFPPGATHPRRIEFEGNDVARVASFAPETGAAIRDLTSVTLPPITVKRRGDNFLSYWDHPKDALLIWDNPEEIEQQLARADLRRQDWHAQLTKHAKPFARVVVHSFIPLDLPEDEEVTAFDLVTPPLYRGNDKALFQDIRHWRKAGITTAIASTRERPLKANLKRAGLTRGVTILPIDESERTALGGLISRKSKFVLLTDKEVFGAAAFRAQKPRRQSAAHRAFLAGLKASDYVVHIDHGIGRFIGMQRNVLDGVPREYFALEYADQDRLFVPVEVADKLSRYVGGDERPTLHRLSGTEWSAIRARVQEHARALAHELLALYAKREVARGYAFPPDTELVQQVEASFPYEETPDQLHAIEEIKHDMESKQPMDRLLVGDVGFGKTEVALRAAVKAVSAGKQVAILAPTTILAEQHTKTFRERLKGLPVKVATLSRFQSRREQQDAIAAIKAGDIDIAIGTHRLLSRDVTFKRLGLIIIDEEQRFGVRAKERLKHLRVNGDLLSMTATPIPRTLNLALANVRDISTIETPPPGRLPINTIISRANDAEVRKALQRELKRGGQVYLLHNHVATIEGMRRKVEELVPKARVAVAHGQLSENKLAETMRAFAAGEIDVLVASTIIENGLDIPTVNTLIVQRATHLGLAQLYQLRGRIGRGNVRAYAYFFYDNKELKGRARERLNALIEATQLGGGFQVAMRDLEIRGAGNILGVEQSGTLQSVGLNLFLRLLRQSVSELRGGNAGPRLDVKVELPLESYMPEEYIENEEDRLLTYQRLADTRSIEELEDEARDLKQRYGTLPAPAVNYVTLLRIRLLAERALVLKVETSTVQKRSGKEELRIILEGAAAFPASLVTELTERFPAWKLKGRTLVAPTPLLGKDWTDALELSLKLLGKLADEADVNDEK